MDRLKLRGLKRRCQNEACALPFYDLNRPAIACPNCGTGFVVQATPAPAPRSNWRSFGGAASIARDRAAAVRAAAVELDEVKPEDTVEEPSFDTDSDAGPLLETEDEEDTVPIEPAADDTTEN